MRRASTTKSATLGRGGTARRSPRVPSPSTTQALRRTSTPKSSDARTATSTRPSSRSVRRSTRRVAQKWGPLQKGTLQTRHGVAEKCAKDRRLPPFWDAAKRASKGSCASGGVDPWFDTHDPKTHASVALTRPFCYASGDFWLMHRTLWHAVGGYIEAGVTRTRKGGLVLAAVGGLDGYSLCRALGLGVPQVTLDGDCVTLHLDHDKKHANLNALKNATNNNKTPIYVRQDFKSS